VNADESADQDFPGRPSPGKRPVARPQGGRSDRRRPHSIPESVLVSPPPHHEFIHSRISSAHPTILEERDPRARISVTLVAEFGGARSRGVAQGAWDVILISGYDGGTGASPLARFATPAFPGSSALSETQQVLVLNRSSKPRAPPGRRQVANRPGCCDRRPSRAEELASPRLLYFEGCIMSAHSAI